VSSTHDLVLRFFSSSLRCTSTLCSTSRTSEPHAADAPATGARDDRATPALGCAYEA
jgi:hypothetical protein